MNIDITSIIEYGIIGLLVLITIIAIISIIRSKKNKEPMSSILDVDLDGVKSNDDREFNYGYEKEDTIVMKPVKNKKKKK